MARKIRVYELARELGLTNKEALDVALDLGIGVKSHSSSIEDAQADRVRRKVDSLGIRRAVQPPEQASGPERSATSTSEGSNRPKTTDAARKAEPRSETRGPSVRSSQPVSASTEVPAPSVGTPPTPPRSEHRVVSSRPAGSDGRHQATSKIPPPPGRSPSAATHAPGIAQGSRTVPPARPPGSTQRPTGSAEPALGSSPAGLSRAESTGQAQVGSSTGAPAPSPTKPVEPSVQERSAAVAQVNSEQRAASNPATARQGQAPQVQRSPGGPGAAHRPPTSRPGPAGHQGPLAATGKPVPPPPGGPPRSATGRPIPPPPRSATGRQIPPPPAGRGQAPRPAGSGGPSGGPSGRPGSGGRSFPGGPRGGSSAGSSPGGSRPGAPGGAGSPGGSPGGGGFGGGGRGGPAAGGRGPGGPPAGGGRGIPGRGRPPQRSRRRRSRRNLEELEPTQLTVYSPSDAPVPEGEVIVERGSTAQDLGPRLNRSAGDVVRFLLLQGEIVTATQSLSDDMIDLFADEVGAKVRLVDPGEEQEAALHARFFDEDEDEDDSNLAPRPPVVTVMGHVDHGKTMLLDRIRTTNVVSGEAGGITQHIGAYQVEIEGQRITFIDTPGHEAFTAMRARGAEVTDIVVLVVAADDGVMPQTLEALAHAKAAEVPILVAINKIDRAEADPNRVMQQLADRGLVPEAWGGDTIMVELSALQNLGVDDLLEQLLVLAEMQELQANPDGKARGSVLEANLDIGRGPVATVMVEQGNLKVGDWIVAGPAWGRVKALVDDRGRNIKAAGPATPVRVLGFSDVPSAGDEMRVTVDQATARTIGEAREQRQRLAGHQSTVAAAPGARLEDLIEQIRRGETATLNLILKADVHGSLEALTESLRKLEREDVKLLFVHRGVGGITENDVQLAAASNATILGFNVRPDRRSRELAQASDVEIRTYEIIYKVLEDIQAAMMGMLEPEYEEIVTGEAEVREIFRVPKVGAVAGCMVRSGGITRGSKVRFLREGVIIWKGAISSLRRFKEDTREVSAGFECGIGLSDFQDLHSGDIIETFEEREIPRT